MTNILVAITNLVKNPDTNVVSRYRSVNRVNSMGDALEFYVKDLLCDSLREEDLVKKDEIYAKHFSYLGNQNNPPDFIIKDGDAIEVKKIENFSSGLALNSSPPKDRLRFGDEKLQNACRNCEDKQWKEKDIFYVVGNVNKGMLRSLFFVHGTCYAANHEVYERVHSPIKREVSSILKSLGFEGSTTVEVGRVKKVDPLGITAFRIRGMWEIQNPVKVFEYVAPVDSRAELSVNALMRKEKYLSFPEKDRKNLEELIGNKLCIKDVKIKDPNNPAKLLEAKLIHLVK